MNDKRQKIGGALVCTEKLVFFEPL